MSDNAITFDIEVAGSPWEEVDEATRGYLMQRARDETEREALPERTGLITGLGKVITIGLWNIEAQRGLVLLEGDSEEQREWDKVPHSDIFRGTEKELLERFWEIVGRKRPRLVSYNGRGYDGPVLMVRSAMLGVKPSVNLLPYRYDISAHCDLFDIFSFQGASRDRYSLDYWCRRFDIESPKGGIDGSQVTRAYREGRIDDIGEYCLRDVRATAELYEKLASTLLPLFKGGPM
ncbi:MAG: DNA polymerase elongation subunit (family B) [Planctomycetota bacterium]|jgi:DNA polymerase elongation subunit (family B)